MREKKGNRIILITGSTDGIGKLTALKLAKRKNHVLVHGRDKEKTERVVKEIQKQSGNEKVEGFVSDFASLSEVRRLAEEVLNKYPLLDILINNAGAGYPDERYSKDGFELRFAVNYLAPFLLTNLLIPALKKAAPSRIVNVSSAGQHAIEFEDIMLEKNFSSVTAYSQSKLAIIMFTFDLAEKLKDENITVNSLHPGTYLDTNMVRRSGINPLGKAEMGADAEVFLATDKSLNGVTGKYFNSKSEAKAHHQAYDKEARKKLWNLGMDLTGLSYPAD
ncbi:MAG TPA: SDR family oxidoreductase [Ignavibacteriaceae bacterium]|nr:SDR family oxidoreductase [Ignavibacteriaceae bacterium]